MVLRVYDTKSRQKRVFKALEKGKVGMYVCGITPYSRSHLGHARCYLSFDIIHRWLEYRGYEVNYVQNFTDIDDKIIAVSEAENIDYTVISQRNIDEFFEVMDKMNILRADHYPRVTQTIPEIIEMVSELEKKGNAYSSEDGVYFDIESAPEKYGQLTGQTLENVRAGAGGRVLGTGTGKKNHRDFALWKLAKPDEPYWESPWGKGRPGWHIECSAMSLKHLGKQFDIHGGGHDLRFPHHEAEIFQSECCTGVEPVVNYWMHNGFVNIDGEKMSKSLGNFWTVSELFNLYSPLALRYALLSVPYRSPIDLTSEFLEDAANHHEKLISAYVDSFSSDVKVDIDLIEHGKSFENSMDDDFNSRGAIIEIQKVISSNCGIGVEDWLEKYAGCILGLLPPKEELLNMVKKASQARENIADKVESLLRHRDKARQNKDWNRADEIREELNEMGVIVEDGDDGSRWKIV